MRRVVPLLIGSLVLGALLWLFLEARISEPGFEPGDGTSADGGATTLEGTGAGREDLNGSSRPGTAGTGAGETPRAKTIRLIGRVVDATRRVVPGARVHVDLEDRGAQETTTDANGAWLVDVGPAPTSGFVMGRVRANTEDGRAGLLAISIWPGTADPLRLDAVVLREAQSLPVLVTGAGQPVPKAAVSLVSFRFGRVIEVARTKTDAAGVARFEAVAPGRYRVFAAAEGHGRAGLVLGLPRADDTPVELALAAERRVDVLVVDGVTGRPVPGAQVHVGDRLSRAAGGVDMVLPPLALPTPTGADGRTQLRGLAAGVPLQVAAWKPGYARPNPYLGEGRVDLAPEATEITLSLQTHRRIRIPVRAGAVPAPRAGTALQLELQAWMAPYGAAQPKAVMERDAVLLEGMPNIFTVGRVTAPDGSWARFMLLAGVDRVQPITFQRPLSLEVSLVDTRGNPVVGAQLRVVGGFAFGPPRRLLTDDDGQVEITGLTQEEGSLYLLPTGAQRGGTRLGSFDLRASPRASFVVADEQVIPLEIVLADETQLPPTYTLMVDGMQKSVAEIEELPDQGELRVSHRSPPDREQVQVELQVPGYLPVKQMVSLAETRAVRFQMSRGGAVVVELLPPADGAFELVLERHDEAQDRWMTLPAQAASQPGGRGLDEHGMSRFEGLAWGRYRARDAVSGKQTEVVALAAGASEETVLLDLSAEGWIEGQVVGPEGHDLGSARVLRSGVYRGDLPLAAQGADVDEQGRFRFRASHGAPVPIEVRHPILQPAEQGGRQVVRVGASGVVLRLEVGSVLRFGIASADPGGARRRPRVLLLPPGGGAHVWSAMPEPVDGRFTVGGFPVGRWRVWIDAYEGVPFSRVVDLTQPDTDLGMLRFAGGGTLILRLPGADFAGGATLIATAAPQEGPAFQRSAMRTRGGDGELRISGLPAGDVHVQVQALGDGKGAGSPTPGSRKTLFSKLIALEADAQRVIDVR